MTPGAAPGGPLRELRSGPAYWGRVDEVLARYPALPAATVCDVAVVGAGITGAMVAFHLARAGVDTVVLERGRAGTGSTLASTALLIYEPDVPLHELIRMRGEPAAVRAYHLCREAVGRIEALLPELGGRCGFARRPSLYLASHEADVAGLVAEHRVRRAHGFPLELLSPADLRARFPFTRPAALWTPDAAEVDAYDLCQRLLGAAAVAGARIFEQTEVRGYEATGNGADLRTAAGECVRARRVVFAAGYETQRYLPRPVVRLKSSYAAASEPLHDFAGWPDRCLIWETARPYLYLRTTAEGRALIGGGDEEFTDPGARDARIGAKRHELGRRFRELFPDHPVAMDFAWAGTFGETDDGLPYVGEVAGFPHAYFSLSYGANGILFALLAGELIRDHLLGRASDDWALFGFDR